MLELNHSYETNMNLVDSYCSLYKAIREKDADMQNFFLHIIEEIENSSSSHDRLVCQILASILEYMEDVS